jgi:hypothetical protein
MQKHQIPAEQLDNGDRIVTADGSLTLPITRVEVSDDAITAIVTETDEKETPHPFKRGELVWISEPILRVVPELPADEDDDKADPDGLNESRAEWAAVAASAMATETGLIRDASAEDFWAQAIGDLLCNLHHLADREGLDFDELAEGAERMYEEETTPFD